MQFEYVPVALMPMSTVPAHQNKAIHAEFFMKGGTKRTRWLGPQGGKYVSLLGKWVDLNFDESL
jgi:hypothetical protein